MGKTGIVTFAFGSPASIFSNQLLSEITSRKAVEFGASVYTQSDLISLKEGIEVEYTGEGLDRPWPTLRVARGAARWATDSNMDKLLVVAATPHLWRAFRDVQYSILELGGKVISLECEEMARIPENQWFSQNSNQKRTRTRQDWSKREIILRNLPFSLYKLVAS